MDEMFARIKEENKDMLRSIHATIEDAVQKEFSKLMDRMDEQQSQLMDLEVENKAQAQEIAKLKAIVEKQQSELGNLRHSSDELEQYSRRNCLQFFGIPESEKESTDDLVCGIINNRLGVTVTTTDIDRSHRVGNPNKPPAANNGRHGVNRPRPIVVKFVSYRTRHLVISNRRLLKGTKVVIQEQLTKKNRELLSCAVKHPKVETAWTSDGRVIAKVKTTNNRTINRMIRNATELASL